MAFAQTSQGILRAMPGSAGSQARPQQSAGSLTFQMEQKKGLGGRCRPSPRSGILFYIDHNYLLRSVSG